MTFGLVVDGVCKSALAPLLDIGDSAVSTDKGLELLSKSSNTLLTDLKAENNYGFVICGSFCRLLHLLLDLRPDFFKLRQGYCFSQSITDKIYQLNWYLSTGF